VIGAYERARAGDLAGLALLSPGCDLWFSRLFVWGVSCRGGCGCVRIGTTVPARTLPRRSGVVAYRTRWLL